MDFFEHQERARRSSGRMVALFVASVTGVVVLIYAGLVPVANMMRVLTSNHVPGSGFDMWHPGLLATIVAVVSLVVGWHTREWLSLYATGGSSVALSLGGRLVSATGTEFAERRLLNLVEETALAAGVPVPHVFVLEREPTINAFAAGYSIDDAAICVSRGALEVLDRDELQAVVAHEFAHILNGDMAINLRLAGVLYGITAIGAAGLDLVRASRFARPEGDASRAKGFVPTMLFGFFLATVGGAGLLVGRLVRAAWSRQREFLADAAAVQFTRTPHAMASALRKIGGFSLGARPRTAGFEPIAHLMFSSVLGDDHSGALSTHPPLAERIRRIDAGFVGTFPPVAAPTRLVELERTRIAEADARHQPQRFDAEPLSPLTATVGLVDAVTDRNLRTPGALADAACFVDRIGPHIERALSTPESAFELVKAIAVAEGAADIGAVDRRADVEPLLEEFRALGEGATSALLRLAHPALARLEESARADARHWLSEQARQSPALSLRAFVLFERVAAALDPRGRSGHVAQFAAWGPLRDDVAAVLAAVAAGSSDPAAALAAAHASLGPRVSASLARSDAQPTVLGAFRDHLERLRHASPQIRASVVRAAGAAVAADGVVAAAESDLLGLVSDLLQVPTPILPRPIVAGQTPGA